MIPANDPGFYDRVVRRVSRIILVLGVIGAVGIAVYRGVSSGLSFLIGSAVSYVSFSSWRYIANLLVPADGPANPKKRNPALFVIRLLALIALAWVIIKFLGLNIAAAALGLLVSGAAVVLEIVYELIYAS